MVDDVTVGVVLDMMLASSNDNILLNSSGLVVFVLQTIFIDKLRRMLNTERYKGRELKYLLGRNSDPGGHFISINCTCKIPMNRKM